MFDPIRQIFIEETPEELVRQALLREMICYLGYPKELLSVEVDIQKMPHITHPLPYKLKRRADIICYAKNIHPQFELYPLILIECKAIPLDLKAERQLMGYNHYVQAFFTALVNPSEKKLGWQTTRGESQFIETFPSFQECISVVQGFTSKVSSA